MYTKADLGGELEEELDDIQSDIEEIKIGCNNCYREHGHRVLCPSCEDTLERYRGEELRVEAEMDRRLQWLNLELTKDFTFGEGLDEVGIYFTWDIAQGMLWQENKVKAYNQYVHNQWAKQLIEVIQWRSRDKDELQQMIEEKQQQEVDKQSDIADRYNDAMREGNVYGIDDIHGVGDHREGRKE